MKPMQKKDLIVHLTSEYSRTCFSYLAFTYTRIHIRASRTTIRRIKLRSRQFKAKRVAILEYRGVCMRILSSSYLFNNTSGKVKPRRKRKSKGANGRALAATRSTVAKAQLYAVRRG